jgi:hypothetical protein
MRIWKKTGSSEYTSNDGHRVYKYESSSGWQTCWAAQPKGSFGDVAGKTKTQAIAYIDRHYPPAPSFPSDDQFLAALGPCGR